MKAYYKKFILNFKRPSGTSRGVLTEKETWFIILEDEAGRKGIGECGILRSLSIDDRPDYEDKLNILFAFICEELICIYDTNCKSIAFQLNDIITFH